MSPQVQFCLTIVMCLLPTYSTTHSPYDWPIWPTQYITPVPSRGFEGWAVQPPNTFVMPLLHDQSKFGIIKLNDPEIEGKDDKEQKQNFKAMILEEIFNGLDDKTQKKGFVSVNRGKYTINVIEKGKNKARLVKAKDAVILAKLDFDHVKFYKWFQEISANKIHSEYHRPTVQLMLVGDFSVATLYTAGILGGLGPIADADVTMRIVKLLRNENDYSNWKQMGLKLLSEPHPRNMEQSQIDTNEAVPTSKANSAYVIRVRDFFHDPNILIFEMTSNTAHRNFANSHKLWINTDLNTVQVSQPSRKQTTQLAFTPIKPNYVNPFSPGTRQWINVIETTTQLIHQIAVDRDMGSVTVLLVGTDQAWEDKLYQKAFDSMGIEYIDLNQRFIPDKLSKHLWERYKRKMKKDYTKPDYYLYKALRAGIQVIKEYPDDKEFGVRLMTDVISTILLDTVSESFNFIAFTCSEVTTALGPEDVYAIWHRVNVGKTFHMAPYTIDTTQLMALNIVKYLQMKANLNTDYQKWVDTFYKDDQAIQYDDPFGQIQRNAHVSIDNILDQDDDINTVSQISSMKPSIIVMYAIILSIFMLFCSCTIGIVCGGFVGKILKSYN